MNYGNTGQRYKMPRIEDVTTEVGARTRIVWHLACGHRRWHFISYEGQLESERKYIGTRTRCDQCKAGKAE